MDRPEPTDAELVARANGGDRTAFAALYERHRTFVLRVAWRLCGQEDLAAEATQETFLGWLKRFPGFELRGRASTFLYPVVRSICIDMARRRRRALRMPARDDDLAGPLPDANSGTPLAAAVSRLPFGQQEVVLLRFGSGLSLEEIAESLDVPVGTVKSRLHLALAALREAVDR
ncbi:MAG: RNA polymerase sigma factor [Phycisphaerales bacterium]|nr:RNA polymerase sigma factor [Phycisphaerales bacterium]